VKRWDNGICAGQRANKVVDVKGLEPLASRV
jgi:hypothetical protein